MTENIIGKGGSTMDVKLSTDKTVFRLLVKDLGYKGEGDRTLAGRAYFKDYNGERIFYHSEIADKFKGRGIGRILVEEDAGVRQGCRPDLREVPTRGRREVEGNRPEVLRGHGGRPRARCRGPQGCGG